MFLCVYLPTSLPTFLSTYIRTYVRTYIHKYLPTYLATYIQIYTNIHMHTYIHTYIHTHSYIDMYKHRHIKQFITMAWYSYNIFGARCSSVVRASAHNAMNRRIDPLGWTLWDISRSSQCSTAAIQRSWYVHIKDPLLLIEKSSLKCSGSSNFHPSLFEWSFTICPTPITVNNICECVIK